MQTFTSAVNQKRVFAELLLQQALASSGRHLQQALLQGAALHLEQAYRLYLGEIAVAYQCGNPAELRDLWTLIANLQLQGKNPAETKEIYNLQERSDSWLSQLHDCCRAMASLPEDSRSGSAMPDPDRIPAFSTSQKDDWSTLTGQQVNNWICAFEEMVERQRDSMVEC